MPRSSTNLQVAFGLEVRRQRNLLGISQEELARRSGLHRTYVSQIERGLKSPSLGALANLASGLSTTAHVLVRAAEEGAEQ